MLVGSRAVGVAVFAPISFTALAVALVAASVPRFLADPSVGAGLGALVALGVAGFITSMYRCVWVAGDRLVSRGLFERKELARDATAIGTKREGGRSTNHEVYATDGTRRAVIASVFSAWGARHTARRLTSILSLDDETGGLERTRAAARAAIATTSDAEDRLDRAMRALVAENQRRYGWLSAVIVGGVVAIVAIYVAVMVYLQHTP